VAKITTFKGYDSDSSEQRPDEKVLPNIVTARDGVPVKYPNCEGLGVRIVHPANPKAPAQNMGLIMFYIPPHVTFKPSSHHTEECYVILRGQGTMILAGDQVQVKAGMFVHLPPWCEHGIENTGDETLEVLICTSPPNP
tara:strand:- start:264 stop:680 length:417 start_codon:yes stop_codon:yes gene_type:complete